MNKVIKTSRDQQGAAVLLVSVILLIGVTLIVMYATRVGVQDQRISGNEVRHKEAFANAEAGLDEAAAYLRANPGLHVGANADGWVPCAGSTVFPCDITGALKILATTTVDGSGAVQTVSANIPSVISDNDAAAYLVNTASGTIAVGVGATADGTGAAVAQISYAKTTLLVPGELPPLMVPSGNLSGNFNIVPNPNGGGPGVPVSVWAMDTLDTTGANWKTCDHGEFKDAANVCTDTKGDGDSGLSWSSCSCDTERSNSGDVDADIVLDSSTAFPSSPFVYVFGTPGVSNKAELITEVRDRADASGILYDSCSPGTNCCSNLAANFAGLTNSALVWADGDCDIGSNVTIGSRAKPIILVVQGEIRVNAGAEVWGILVGLGDFVLNGGPVIHGSAISDIPSDLTNGNYSQVYDEAVFNNLVDDAINTDIAKVKYSWRDFTP
ncbi:MAG: PilX N-terminal domain-containing pilus assembly protein [Methylophagaceae bacterium]